MPKTNKFPNGFTSWSETHFEIVTDIAARVIALSDGSPQLARIQEAVDGEGRTGLYTLAADLTYQFEAENLEREWDGEWWEVLDEFLEKELG